MITPRRFTNLNYCLVYVSSLVIECLLSRGQLSLDELFRYCKLSNEEINEQDVTLSVSFLFLLNKARYIPDSDLVELSGNLDA
jgi:hypothetical protein